MTDYSFNATALTVFCASRECVAEGDELCRWADLVDSIGPSSLPFVIKRSALADVPFPKLGIQSIDPASLTPKRGEMWVLFCYTEEMRHRFEKDGALRSDGFPLVLEWRKDVQDSPLLSTAFRRLADLVRKQLNVEGWGLWPSFDRYGDKVDFVDPDLFGVESDLSQVASAYGALVTGLFCAIRNRFPPEWTFPTLQWDWDRGETAGVAGIESKITVAADFGARYVSVAAKQAGSARATQKELTRADRSCRLRRLSIVSVAAIRSPMRLAESIAFRPYQRRRLIKIGVASLVFFLSSVSLFLWDSMRSVSLYYSAFVDRYGLPQGIYPLSTEAVKHRTGSFRFDYSGVHWGRSCHSVHRNWQVTSWFGLPRRLVCVAHVNARNVPTQISRDDFDSWPMIMRFGYSDLGNVDKIYCHRRGGEDFVSGPVEKVLHFFDTKDSINGSVEEKNSQKNGSDPIYGRGEMSVMFHPENELLQEHSRICSSLLQRDEQGRIVRRIFRASDSEPTRDHNGVGGFEYRYTQDGLVSRKICLGDIVKGHPELSRTTSDRQGVMFTDFIYENGNLKEMVFFNSQTNRTRGAGGVSRWLCELDEWGNQISHRMLDEKDRPVNLCTGACWLPMCEFRSVILNGFALTNECWAVDDHNRLAAVFHSVVAVDERGDEIARHYLDSRKKPGVDGTGVSVQKCVRDPQTGDIIESRYFGRDGVTPVYCQNEIGQTISGLGFVYDADGNQKCMTLLDGDGGLMKAEGGWTTFEVDYEDGRIGGFAYFDKMHQPVRDLRVGYHRVKAAYKEANLSTLTCFDEYNRKTLDADEVCEYCYQYDDCGRVNELVFKNESNELCRARSRGYCKMTRIYQRLPVNYPYGYNGSRLPEGGEMVIERFFGSDGKTPMRGVDGEAETRKIYDVHWNCVYQSAHDESGNLIALTNSSYAAVENVYDDRGLVREVSYWSPSGSRSTGDDSLTRGITGHVHRIVYEYDAAGKLCSQKFYNTEGLPSKHCNLGYHEERTVYDVYGRMQQVSFWNSSGSPAESSDKVHLTTFRYNDRGDRIETAYFGVRGVGDRVLSKSNRAWKILEEFNECGRRTCCRRMGLNNKPIESENGCAYANFAYDEHNRLEEVSFFNEDDTPAVNDVKCARMKFHYRLNSMVEERVECFADKSCEVGPYFLPDVTRLVVRKNEEGQCYVDEVDMRNGINPCSGALTVVAGMVPDRAAAQNGIRVGDIICSVNGSDAQMFGQLDFCHKLVSLVGKEKTVLIARWTPMGYALQMVSCGASFLGVVLWHGVKISDDLYQQLKNSISGFSLKGEN